MGLFRKRPPESDCIYCGLPLSGDHDGWAHAGCRLVVEAADAAAEIEDNRDLGEAEASLRSRHLCPWQIRAPGWDGGGIYCGRPIYDSGDPGNPCTFCPEHQCEDYGDDEGAAQERAERTVRLLEQAGLGEAT